MKLYFECTNGISGDMSVGALLDLGADKEKLKHAFSSLGLGREFNYEISEVKVNSIKAVDFNVKILNHHHTHRHLKDIEEIIDKADMSQNAKNLSKKIFKIVANAEAKVHSTPLEEVHFHEVGAIDSIADIIGFSVLYDDLNPEKTYISTIQEGQGTVMCAHGRMNVPAPAVCEILSTYNIPFKITNIEGEMVTPTGCAIVAALYNNEQLKEEIVIEKVGYGAGKRPYPNPVLRVMQIQ
ncbi:LarC family nickel insertion protein [bacterium]|nr:LarC family nickel insertion protein [bacterium]